MKNLNLFASAISVVLVGLGACDQGDDTFGDTRQSIVSTSPHATPRMETIPSELRSSVVTLVSSTALTPSSVKLKASLNETYSDEFCDGEPFADQKRIWGKPCSGTIVAPDLVLTAWHCLDNVSTYVVRGYKPDETSSFGSYAARAEATVVYKDEAKDIALVRAPNIGGTAASLYCGSLDPGLYMGGFAGNGEGLQHLYRRGQISVSSYSTRGQITGFEGDSGSGLLLDVPAVAGNPLGSPAVVGVATDEYSSSNCQQLPDGIMKEKWANGPLDYGRGRVAATDEICMFRYRNKDNEACAPVRFSLWEDVRSDFCSKPGNKLNYRSLCKCIEQDSDEDEDEDEDSSGGSGNDDPLEPIDPPEDGLFDHGENVFNTGGGSSHGSQSCGRCGWNARFYDTGSFLTSYHNNQIHHYEVCVDGDWQEVADHVDGYVAVLNAGCML